MTSFVSEVTASPIKECGAQPPSAMTTLAMSTQIQMMTGNELARALGYEGVTGAFRSFCQAAGIKPLPGRRDCFDPIAVRRKLDDLQGLSSTSMTLVEQRRARNGT